MEIPDGNVSVVSSTQHDAGFHGTVFQHEDLILMSLHTDSHTYTVTYLYEDSLLILYK